MRIRQYLTKPEDFIVEEEIDKKFLRSFERTGKGVRKVEGPYTLFLLKKKGMNTKDAIKTVAEKSGVSREKIGYAGLKDKFAVTSQYVTIKNFSKPLRLKGLELKRAGSTNRHISVGDLTGNRFSITLHGVQLKTREKFRVKFPNYFGPQRFGRNFENHKNGKLLLEKQFQLVKERDKAKLKFYVHAYQSHVFNEALKYCLKNKIKAKKLPVPGYDTRLSGSGKVVAEILKKEKIGLEDFRINELRMTCSGSAREAFVETAVNAEKMEDGVRLSFSLPKGSYATVLIDFLMQQKKLSER